MTRIYLDHNATAPLWPEAAAAMTGALAITGNPSAVHEEGRKARRLIEEAREALAALAGVRASQIVFTSGGTEANALAIRGSADSGMIGRIVVSAIEHPSVIEAAKATKLPLDILPVTPDGVVVLEAVEQAARARTLICVMSANNETGVIQPIAEVARIAKEAGAFLHVDAVQTAGRDDIDFEADLISLSAHKLGGPRGVGALIVKDSVTLAPLFAGGQERRRRAGTENVTGIAGFGAAIGEAPGIARAQPRIAALRDRLEAELAAATADAVVFGAEAPRLANTSCFATPGLASALQVMSLDLSGIAVSAGAACSSGKVERSHVLTAMGAERLAGEAIRVSLGWNTSEADIDGFLEAYGALLNTHRALHSRAYGT